MRAFVSIRQAAIREAIVNFVNELSTLQDHAPRDSSPPSPEEGHRLMRAFVSIRQAAMREAVVNFVNELSTLKDEN